MAAEPVQRRLQFVLDEYQIYPNDNVTLCYFGMANEVFIVPTKDGKYVLKNCFKSNTIELISNEIALIEHLNQHGCPTPKIVPTKAGKPFLDFDGEIYLMTEYCPDQTYNWSSDIPLKAHRETVHAQADFHNATQNFVEPNPGLRGEFLAMGESREWLNEIDAQLAEIEATRKSVGQMAELVPRLTALVDRLESEMSQLDLTPLVKCYIHGDLHCFNLFYDQENNYSSVIDFDFSRYDHRLMDIYWSSRILYFREMRKRFTIEELKSDHFEPPEAVVEDILYGNWKMIIEEYRRHAELPAQELALIHLFVKAVPLYIMKYFNFTNSEAECLEHIDWFEWELSQIDVASERLQAVIERVLHELN